MSMVIYTTSGSIKGISYPWLLWFFLSTMALSACDKIYPPNIIESLKVPEANRYGDKFLIYVGGYAPELLKPAKLVDDSKMFEDQRVNLVPHIQLFNSPYKDHMDRVGYSCDLYGFTDLGNFTDSKSNAFYSISTSANVKKGQGKFHVISLLDDRKLQLLQSYLNDVTQKEEDFFKILSIDSSDPHSFVYVFSLKSAVDDMSTILPSRPEKVFRLFVENHVMKDIVWK